jgi:hypothetical protein
MTCIDLHTRHIAENTSFSITEFSLLFLNHRLANIEDIALKTIENQTNITKKQIKHNFFIVLTYCLKLFIFN